MIPSPAPHVAKPNRRPEVTHLFEPFSYTLAATTRGLADASLPGAADDDGLPCPRSQSRASRSTLLDWVAVAGFAAYGFGLPAILAEYLS